jgi:HlyD family secretion protein
MAVQDQKIDEKLAGLRIDRSERQRQGSPRWTKWWILAGIAFFVLLGVWAMGFGEASAVEVETVRVTPQTAGESGDSVALEAAGYVVPHHKIEVASKVVGKVAWIGVEKGDPVKQGQVMVRLENDEYVAQVRQEEGNLAALKARLRELQNGSRPEEIALANANVDEAKANLRNARTNLERAKLLAAEGVFSKQELDDAQARYDAQAARVQSLDRAFELMRIGPRQEQIDALKGQVSEAEGRLALARTRLDGTEIRAPVTGTILERNVEIGEFVTTSFVGERGAKGYVVSLADLNDLQVELDISQDDFAKLHADQRGEVWTDAFPDRKYAGTIFEISPEADRQKATVQVKVQVHKPDTYLRPEMNANVAFLAEPKSEGSEHAAAAPAITIPSSALRDGNTVFVMLGDRAVKRAVKTRQTGSRGVEISEGLIGGEELILAPPPDLKDGDKVRLKSS